MNSINPRNKLIEIIIQFINQQRYYSYFKFLCNFWFFRWS